MLSASEIYDLLYEACDNAKPEDGTVVDIPIFGDTDLKTVKKLKWNGVTFWRKGGHNLWHVYNQVVMIGLYSYELAYLINNSGKKAIILEVENASTDH
jgi:hypothetical protein